MARTVNVPEHTAKRHEILAAAQRLVYIKGFEQVTIQDLLDDLQISKGAFYHYFPSKSALLEGIVQQMLDEALKRLQSVVSDPTLPACAKLQRYFAEFFRWRVDRKEMLLAILPVWYADDNALLRQKLRIAMLQHFTPLVTDILRQGMHEGTLACQYPEQMAQVVVLLRMGLAEALGALLLTLHAPQDDLTPVEQTITAFTEAIGRVLGITEDGLQVVDTDVLGAWF